MLKTSRQCYRLPRLWPWLLALALACLSGGAAADAERPMYFRHLGVAEGLSQNAVFAMHQDRDGFLWIGTEQGLNRYDGYEVTQYHRTGPPEAGLPDSFIYDLAEDNEGNLWIATARGGLARWDRGSEQIVAIDLGPDSINLSLRTLQMRPSGDLWIGTLGEGVLVYNIYSRKLQRHRHDPAQANSLASNSVYDFEPDRSGGLWIATDGGLSRFDAATRRFSNYRHDPQDAQSLSHNRVRSLTTDQRQQLWVGTMGGGVSVLEPLSQTFRRYRHDDQSPVSLSSDQVRSVFMDDEQRLWIGTESGLNLYEEQHDHFSQYRAGRAANELSDNDVLTMTQDNSGQVWLGTRNAGVNIWNPRGWLMGHRRPEWTADANVTSFAGQRDWYWVGTFGKGVVQVHKSTGEHRQYTTAQGLKDDRVMSLQTDDFGKLWIGSMQGGLSHLDQATGLISAWQGATSPAMQALTDGGIMSLLLARDGSLWVGTFGSGLWRLDARSEHPLKIGGADWSVLNGRQIMALAEDASGMIWVGTDAGLHLLNPHRGVLASYQHDRNDPQSLSADAVYALHVDPGNRLWIGTSDGGVDRWIGNIRNPQQGLFENLSAERLRMRTVYGIRSDRSNRLWISGNSGIASYTASTGKVVNYGPAHGLQSSEFNFGAHYSDRNGFLYFGGANGYNRFRSERLNPLKHSAPLVLTEYTKQNSPVLAEAPFSDLSATAVRYSDSVLSFEFAMLDFIDPSSNRYSYLLEGFDEQWSPFTTQRRATYTNLDPGDYQLRVRARNASGTTAAKELAIDLSVAPPPWATGWAYMLYGMLALGLLLLAYRNHRHRLARAAHIQQLAFYDTLTGLPNRHLFLTETAHHMIAPNRVSLLLLGLDRFKRINDTLGHELGDEVLKVVAKRLQRALDMEQLSANAPELSLSRLGSDEFSVTIVERNVGAPATFNAPMLAQRLAEQLTLPITDQGLDLVVTASMGLASYPADASNLVTLLKHADAALSHAKASGRVGLRVYTSVMDERAAERLALEADIRRALEQDEFQLFYQPKYVATDRSIAGAEALLRWQRSDGSWVSPFEILSIAQELGFSTDIDRWVLEHACQTLSRWREMGMRLQPVAVNLSTASLCRAGFAQWLCALTERYAVPAALLELEITESALMEDRALAESMLHTLKLRGFRIAIDDFGTGYSSLAYLKQFSVDVLKIDRSFVMDLENDPDSQALCRAMIAMAHSLSLEVVAEGVETEVQSAFLQSHQVDFLQGYLLAKPLPCADYERLLQAPEGLFSAG